MKMTCWILFGVMISTSLLAQQAPSAAAPGPIETPAPAGLATNVPAATAATNAPVKAPKKSPAPKKKAPAVKHKDPAAELRTVPLVPGPATVDANNVNVRGQAKLKSEVVSRLKKGDSVTVLQEIVNNHSAADEPSAWAKILLPTNAHVWVSTRFIDGTNKTVMPKKLNLRSGPGENYSVLGQLVHGDPVTEITVKGEWLQIEAPTNAYAFIAAQYLKQAAAPALVASTTPTEPAPTTTPTPTPVPDAPNITTAPTETPTNATPAELASGTNAPTEILSPPVEPSTTEPAPVPIEEPPPKRIVQREGFVRGVSSIQAPTQFGLVNIDNGKLVDYLYTTSPNLDLRRYKGLRIIVAGEEGLDDRWGNTPVITIQKIQVVE